MLICLPSLFIFACLSGAEVTPAWFGGRARRGALRADGVAPSLVLRRVAWVFSQSTDSVAFIGALHLVFWLIGLSFGLRLLRVLMDLLRVTDRAHIKVWSAIFILVSLQMTTALRPIVGTSDHWLPTEKKFFLVHWGDNLFKGALDRNSD